MTEHSSTRETTWPSAICDGQILAHRFPKPVVEYLTFYFRNPSKESTLLADPRGIKGAMTPKRPIGGGKKGERWQRREKNDE